jgi:hypothetical protein
MEGIQAADSREGEKFPKIAQKPARQLGGAAGESEFRTAFAEY